MAQEIDQLMESASQALAEMDYLTCEAVCLKALAAARAREDWAAYARILLPLQEARRQRRMIAADGVVLLGTAMAEGTLEDWLQQRDAGCIAVSHPHTREDAESLQRQAREHRHYVEVLYADNTSDEPRWVLRSVWGPDVSHASAAPMRDWIDKPLDRETQAKLRPAKVGSATPIDWFLDAAEGLGDAALATINSSSDPREQLDRLEACLSVVTDHEILHQRLGDVARQLQRAAPRP